MHFRNIGKRVKLPFIQQDNEPDEPVGIRIKLRLLAMPAARISTAIIFPE
jgi:hypothetical protein